MQKIANVAIYSDAKTQSQIQDIMFSSYSTLTSELKTNLVSWYDLGSTELGSELVTNGGMELDANWINYSSPTVNERSKEQVYAGSYSRKFTSDSGDGIRQSNISVTSGRSYKIKFWVYPVSNTQVGVGFNDGSWTIDQNVSGLITDAWNEVEINFTASSTVSTAYFIVYDRQPNTGTWYVDNASIREILATDSQGDNEGSIYGATTNTGYTNSPSGVADPLNYGEIYGGNAVSFDGINDFIDIDSVISSISSNTVGTLSAWVNFADLTTDWDTLFGFTDGGASGTNRFVLRVNNTNNELNVHYASGGTTQWRFETDNTYNTGQWYFLQLVQDGTEPKLYIDGIEQSITYTTATDKTQWFNNLGTFSDARIGCEDIGGNTRFISGKINNVKIFSTALTQDQIRELYTKPELTLPTGVASSALKLDMPMQEGSGVAILDGSGNQNHGTGNGITWATGQEYGFQHPLVRSNNPMVFDGGDDKVTVGTPSALNNIFTGGGTLSAWINPKSDGQNNAGQAFDKSKYAFQVIGESSGSVKVQFAVTLSGGAARWETPRSVSLNTWTHILVTYDSDNPTTDPIIYLNGSAVSLTETISPSGTWVSDASSNLLLGNRNDGVTTFDGLLNDLAIWSSALTANEVTALYNSGLPLLPTANSGNYASADDLVGYWRNDGVTTWIDKANTGVASFAGGADKITINSNLFSGTNATMSGWVKADNLTSSREMFFGSQDSSGSRYDYVVLWEGSSIRVYIEGTLYNTSISLNSNTWYLLTITTDGTNVKLYVNGSLQYTASNSDTLNSGTDFVIGSDILHTLYVFNGQIASTNIFNTALSATEVSELYAIDKRSSISGHSKFSNCVASWLMGAGTGDTTSTIQDQTSNNNDATVSGANLIGYNDGTVAGDPASIIVPEGLNEGRDSQGYYLTDTDSISSGIRFKGAEYISVQDSESLSFGNGTSDLPFSLEAWIKPNDVTNFEVFAKGVYNSTGEYLFGFEADDKLKFYLFDESVASTTEGVLYNTALTSSEGQWMHIVGTYDGRGGTSANAGMKIYLNGSQVNNGTESAGTYVAMENLSANLEIGKYSSNYAKGSIDEAKVYSKELSASEVLKNYNNGKSAHSN
jgi:hypothetical protein